MSDRKEPSFDTGVPSEEERLVADFKAIEPGIIKMPYPPVGTGDGWVYCYYFPYIRRAKEKSRDAIWPCKIGMTVREVDTRIAEQLNQTGIFEAPEVGFSARHPDAALLEARLHDLLAHRKISNNGAGSEWFETNLAEVRRAYRRAVKPGSLSWPYRVIMMMKMEITAAWLELRRKP